MKRPRRFPFPLLAALLIGPALFAGPATPRPAQNGLTPGTARALAARLVQRALEHFATRADPCANTAELMARATLLGHREDFGIALAECANLDDPDEAEECLEEAVEQLTEDIEEVEEQYDARIELCELLGGGTYDPEIDPDDFVEGIDNPLLPFSEGREWTYMSLTSEGLEVIDVVVTDETREILDVECTVVRDTVTLDGELVEDTFDYYAQDEDGNVWYFGELSMSYEDGYLVELEGSWIGGEDGAKPGIVMYAAPPLGTTYRQEFLLDEAEDAATVVSLDEDVTVPAGTFTGCVQTEDFTPLEPDVLENKYYFPGVGLVLEEDPDSGERVELVSYR